MVHMIPGGQDSPKPAHPPANCKASEGYWEWRPAQRDKQSVVDASTAIRPAGWYWVYTDQSLLATFGRFLGRS